jgi:hypothetical protein
MAEPDPLNLKKSLKKRMEGVESDPTPPAPPPAPSMSQSEFGKPFTPEERRAQMAALAQKLRDR